MYYIYVSMNIYITEWQLKYSVISRDKEVQWWYGQTIVKNEIDLRPCIFDIIIHNVCKPCSSGNNAYWMQTMITFQVIFEKKRKAYGMYRMWCIERASSISEGISTEK